MSYIRSTTAALLVLTAPLAAGAQSVSVPEHVPGDIKGMITVTDMNGAWNSWSATPLAKSIESFFRLPALQNEPDFQEFVLEIDKAELELGYGLRPNQLLGETIRGLDIYVVRPETQAEPDFVVVSKFSHADRVEKLVSYLKSMEEEENADRSAAGLPPVELTSTTIGDVEVTGSEELQFQFGGSGDVFLFSNSLTALESAITSTGADRLKGVEPLQRGYSKVSDRAGQVTFYLDGSEALKAASQFAPTNDFGTLTTGPTVGTLNFTPQGIDFAWFTGMDNPTEAEKAVLAIPPSPMKGILSFMDGTPLFAASSNQLDGPLLLRLSEEAASTDPSAMGQMDAFKQQIETMTGLDFEEEIVPAFGPDVSLAIQDINFAGGMMPQFDALAILKIRDAEKAGIVIDKFEQQMAMLMTEQMRQMNPSAPAATPNISDYQGTTLRSIPFSGGPVPIPLSLTHAVTSDGYWILALSEDSIKAALGRHTGGGNSLAAVTSSASSSGRIPGEFNTLTVMNFRQMATTVGQVVPMFAGMMGAGADMEAVNLGLEIVRNMGVGYATTSGDGDGQRGSGRLVLQ